MKKLLSYLLLIVLLLPLAGCTDNQNEKYKVVVTGETDILINPIRARYQAGSIVKIKAHGVTDVSLHVFVDGVEVPMSEGDYDYWLFEFRMPAKDITIHLTFDEFYGKDEYTFDDLIHYTAFLNMTINKVAVKTSDREERYSLAVTKYSESQEVISDFKEIFNQKLIKVDDPAVTNFKHEITFYYETETHRQATETIDFIDNYYYWYDFSRSQFFRFENEDYLLPTIETPDLVTYSFLYDSSNEVKKCDTDEVVYRFFDITKVEFIPYEGENVTLEPQFYLDTRYGKIYLMNSTVFGLNGSYYEIVINKDYWIYDYLVSKD